MTLSQLRLFFRARVNMPDTTVLPDSSSGSSDLSVDTFLQCGMEAFNRKVGAYGVDSTVALTAGENEAALPTGLTEVLWVEHQGKPLKKTDQEEWLRNAVKWRDEPAGLPREYTLWGRKIIVYPKPTAAAAASSLTIRHIGSPVLANNLSEFSDQDHRIIGYYAIGEYLMCAFSLMPELAEYWFRAFERESDRVASQYFGRMLRR